MEKRAQMRAVMVLAGLLRARSKLVHADWPVLLEKLNLLRRMCVRTLETRIAPHPMVAWIRVLWLDLARLAMHNGPL